MIGLGTQDDADYAVEFVETTGTTSFPMYWDETFETWTAFGINAQPAVALLSPDGEPIAGWLGGFPEDEILDAIRSG